MPFLGICRGMQILNVTFGGDLLQSIDTDPLHAKFEQMEELAHPVRIVPGSKLSQMGVPDEFMVNSAHHQAVGTLGQGLTVEATAEDGGEAKVPVGSFIQPHNFNRWFKDFCADNGFGRYTKNARTITRAGRTLVRGNGYEGIKRPQRPEPDAQAVHEGPVGERRGSDRAVRRAARGIGGAGAGRVAMTRRPSSSAVDQSTVKIMNML